MIVLLKTFTLTLYSSFASIVYIQSVLCIIIKTRIMAHCIRRNVHFQYKYTSHREMLCIRMSIFLCHRGFQYRTSEYMLYVAFVLIIVTCEYLKTISLWEQSEVWFNMREPICNIECLLVFMGVGREKWKREMESGWNVCNGVPWWRNLCVDRCSIL